jgi:quercetin dioxygenase-like cupin family protein
LEDKAVINDAEVHVKEADLWYVLEGEVTFIHSGEMVQPWFGKNKDGSENKNEIKAKEIKGGEKVTLREGDWFWIPAGVPHIHKTDGVCRMAIIKIPKCD